MNQAFIIAARCLKENRFGVLLAILVCLPLSLEAQNRDIRGERIVLDDNGNDGVFNTMTIQAPSLAADRVYTWPSDAPFADSALLVFNPDGTMYWTFWPSVQSLTVSDGLTVTGGTIDFTGASSIDMPAGSVDFDDIGSGTNLGEALIIGNGSSLVTTGTGILASNQFVGTGSTTPGVDLATGEVAGILPIANGGTGGATAGDARTNLGLGTMATQDASSVAITGGTISGVTLSGNIAGSPTLTGTPDFSNGITVSGGAVDFSGAASVDFDAGSIGFEDIGSGTSLGQALVIGNGSSLSATGTGTLTANEFAGTGSTTTSVDLATGEVAGILPIANGGTGGATAGDARTNLGLGTMATQDASSVAITGGTISGVTLSGNIAGSPTLTGTPDFSNGITVSGGAVDFSGAASVDFGAGSIGFEDIGSGTSLGQALVIGNGSSLSATGTGTLTANEFAGTGSTTTSVDLATGEVAGILPIANGGTGGATAGDARTNLGLGTMATQDANSVAITGGTISGVTLSGNIAGSPTLTGTPDFSNGITVSGGVVDFSGAASVDFGAGSIGFEDIGSGTSLGQALVIGNGSSLSATGTGTLTANEFVGTGSTTTSVDLATGEVAGILPIANGGTGGATAGDARTNLGLGTMATQDANSVAITGGTISGVTLSGNIAGSPTLTGTPDFGNGLTVSGGVVDLSGAASINFGTGTIGFDNIGSGTSLGQALVIGNGSSLSATGTGTLTANEFAGTGSTTTSVDLATGEVAGILPIANGGTGGATAGDARTNLGLGTMATQDANSVAITGGTISGVTLSGNIAGSPTLTGTPDFSNGITVSGGAVDFSGAASVDFGAGSIGFEDIGSGTSLGQALVIGNGSSLSATGTGTLTANEFAGTGSTTTSVDLATGEVAGILPIANGGTGGATAGDARTNLGLGTMATQDASSVAITGGTISGVTLSGNIGFEDIGSGTSLGQALVIGNGSSLSATGTGTLTANEFAGTGSTTTGVDLATGEVAGVLPIANGGTNSTAAPTAGGVVYGDGTSYQVTAAGTAGQVLISNGAGAPTWGSASSSLTAPVSITGSPVAGSMLLVNEDGANTPNLFELQENGTTLVVVENNGETGFGTDTPDHVVHAVNTLTTDERAAVYGEVTSTTADQALAIWGDANNTSTSNTGTIAVLATGNGNTTAGQTNIAMQVNDGEFNMGRTTQTGTGYTVVESASGGTGYTAQGPSGVVEIAIPGIIVALPAVGQSLFSTAVTVNNRYVTANSIVLVTVQSLPSGVLALLGGNVVASSSVSNRGAGTFDLHFSLHNLGLLGLNIGAGNVRIGYMVINPSR